MIEKNDRKKATKEYFDSQAEFYDISHDGRFVKCMYQEIVKRVMSLPGEKILDLGCGNGNIISLLKEKRKGDYYGADISPKMIQEAKKRLGQGAELKVADVVKLPYETDMFDIIICNASFHHYTEPDKAIEEIKRILKKEGVLILGDPTLPGELMLKIINSRLKDSDSGDYRIYGKKQIIPLFQAHGLSVNQWKRINYRTFLFNAVKK